eukprot:6471927-Amphidinium_carterae.1
MVLNEGKLEPRVMWIKKAIYTIVCHSQGKPETMERCPFVTAVSRPAIEMVPKANAVQRSLH